MTDQTLFAHCLSRIGVILDVKAADLKAAGATKTAAAAMAWLSDPDRAFDVVTRCRPESVVQAIFDFAAMGVAPDPMVEWGYFRRRGDTARPGLGYKGVIYLLTKDPAVHSVDVQAIYAGDTDGHGGPAKVILGTSPRIEHAVNLEAARGDTEAAAIVGVYGVLHYRNGGPPKIEYMTRAQVEQVRAESADPQGDPWRHWWAGMARKSVVHRLRKYVQVAPELAHVLASDESGEYAPAAPAPEPAAAKSKLDTLEEAADLYGAPKG
jgi:phage RecT family recombinase